VQALSGAGERIVIVGGGPAAKAAAEGYRESGGAGTVTILAREADPPYERPPLTKGFLRGESGLEELALADRRWYEERVVDLRTGTEVSDLDLGATLVRTAAGEEHPFDRLLLATGADPLVPPIPGADGPGVQTMRRIGDSERLGKLGRQDSALVAGSGFIGCEAAASLAMRGVTVTVATLESAPQVERLGSEVAAEITAWLESLGVELMPEAELAELRSAGDRSTRARFTDRHETVVDRVLVALGVVRNDGLAAAAGLPVEDGVQVDAAMRTPDPRVLAAGDVAFAFNSGAGRRLRVEHWGEASNMGAVAGQTMAGVEADWGVAPGFWSTIGEHTIKYAGWGDGWDRSRFEPGDDGAWACWYGQGEELVAVAAHRDDRAYERGRELIEERAKWS
jgi:NADPH-dependent 2,4-dienoyl-CoA reductase/sulfur reductase-like enzyme